MKRIYRILCTVNNKSYVGCTKNVFREKQHLKELQRGAHYTILQNDFDTYGESSFIVETLEECESHISNEREKYWISHFDSRNNGYNLTEDGNGHFQKGGKHTEDTKKKISEANKNKIVTEETRKKISESINSIVVKNILSMEENNQMKLFRKEKILSKKEM